MALPRATPPPLPSLRRPPPIPARPGDRPGEFNLDADRRSNRDMPNLPGGHVFERDIAVNSTNVDIIRADRDRDLQTGSILPTCTITITFLDGSRYEYPNRPQNDFLDLYTSSSKGRFSYFEVRGPGPSRPGMGIWTHRKLNGPTRSKEQVAALKKSRQPVTEQQKKRYYNVGGRRHAGGGTPSRR